MSTLKVNRITNVADGAETNDGVQLSVPLHLKHLTTSPDSSSSHGFLYVKADGILYYRHSTGTSGDERPISGTSVSADIANTFTAGQFINGGTPSQIQLRVQAHADQSVDIMSIEKSDATTCLEVTSAGVVSIPLDTDSTTTSTGALVVAGGVGIATDLNIGDDLTLKSNSAVLGFGPDPDVTLTHNAGVGLILNSTNKLAFARNDEYIRSIGTGQVEIGAGLRISLKVAGTDQLVFTGNSTTISNFTLNGYREQVQALTEDTNVAVDGSTGQLSFDLKDGNIATYTLEDEVIVSQKISSIGDGQSWTMIISQDGSVLTDGGNTPWTWAFKNSDGEALTIKWNKGEVGEVGITANKTDIFTFFTPNGASASASGDVIIYGMQGGYQF